MEITKRKIELIPTTKEKTNMALVYAGVVFKILNNS